MNHSPKRAGTDPVDLVPGGARRWAEEFVVEQRLLGVAGDRIGDALVTAASHLQESGESAEEAFGDAREYARALAGDAPGAPLGPLHTLGIVGGVTGMLAVGQAVPSALAGTAVEVSGGLLAVAGIVALLLTGLLVAPTPALRLLVNHRWLAVLLPLVLVGGGVALLLTWPEGLLQVPAAPTGAVGLALLAVASLLTWLDYQDDAITAPGGALRRSGRARIGSAVVMPGLTLVVVALAALTHVLS